MPVETTGGTSFVEAVTPHTPAMARLATAIVGPADAEDAAQEALIRAWRGWGGLRERDAVRPWLLRITLNVCRNWRAGHHGTVRRLTDSLDAADAPAALLDLPAPPGPGSTEHAEALDLRRALGILPDEQRLIVVLRYYASLDASDIGALLDIPPATVRTRLRRALTRLRERLAGSGPPATPDEGNAPSAPDVPARRDI